MPNLNDLSRREREELASAILEAQRRGISVSLPVQTKSSTKNELPSRFTFRGANAQLLKFKPTLQQNEVILSGPAETGKTIAALQLVDNLARRYPGATGAIVRKVRNDMAATVLHLFNEEFADGAEDVYKFGGEHTAFYKYANGTRIYVSGLDRAARVLSGAMDFCYVNQAEELTLSDWETLSTRTTGRAGVMVPGFLFADANPSTPYHWILQREREGALLRFNSTHEDNPRLFDENGILTDAGRISLSKLDRLTGIRKQRLRYGKWVQAEGAIYDDWDVGVHVLPHFDIPDTWSRFRVIDFGLVHPFVCQWWALDEDRRMYLYRELYMTGRTVEQHARKILELSEGEFINTTVCDHDAEDRLTLAQHGVPNVPANKAVLQGIGKVKDRLKLQLDKRPRLFILQDALAEIDPTLVERRVPYCTMQEVESYTWEAGLQKEQPVKEDDHGMDALRYAVMYCDKRLLGKLMS